jgi:hypothetical protein
VTCPPTNATSTTSCPAENGPTSQFNGRLECPTQNRHPDKHDHYATPQQPRPVTRLDELRARLRWRYHRQDTDDTGEDDDQAV